MKINKIFAIMTCVAGLSFLSACSDDDVKTPLPDGTATVENISYDALTFNWTAVPGAIQYGYELSLTETGDVVNADVTKETEVTFSGLKDDTDYTLTVHAYAPYESDKTTSSFTTSARTIAIIVLAKPEVTAVQRLYTVDLSWKPVADVDEYEYTIVSSTGEEIVTDYTTETSVNIPLEIGEYKATVTALTYQGGYQSSEPTSIAFAIEDLHTVAWTVEGTFTNELSGETYKTTMDYYNDEMYTINAWYNIAGYTISFSVVDGDFELDTTGLTKQGTYYLVPTGLTGTNKTVRVHSGNSTFEGSQASGKVTIAMYSGGWKYGTFEW